MMAGTLTVSESTRQQARRIARVAASLDKESLDRILLALVELAYAEGVGQAATSISASLAANRAIGKAKAVQL